MNTADDVAIARRALPLLDLTSLNDDDNEARIDALCAKAVTKHGNVAAVCIWPRFVARARKALRGSDVRVATVVNFPAGALDARLADVEIAAAIEAGAQELDVVFPYREWLGGRRAACATYLKRVRESAERKPLKIILESGAYGDRFDALLAASQAAIDSGANFLKTSTGKIPVGATPAAAEFMLRAIAKTKGKVGFKASGGIRTLDQAALYLRLADEMIRPGWAKPKTFRFGASGLLDAILSALGAAPAERAKDSY